MNDTVFRILAAVILLTGAAISSYHRRKADREGGDKISLKEEGLPIAITLRLLGLALWAGVFAYLLNPAWMSWSRVDLPEWARWVGLGMGVLADGLAYWVFSSLGNNVSPTVITRAKHELVTTGPYRWVRHPLYVMGFIAYLGFALVSENLFIAVVSVLGFIGLAIRLRKEESQLIERFGDEYRAYMRRTGKFLPRVS
jgi:protein-S-isoprenylcysteine O-methyltransferase Ste14